MFFFLLLYAILQVFGLWLPPAKGRSGTPALATKSWYKKKILNECTFKAQNHRPLLYTFKILTFREVNHARFWSQFHSDPENVLVNASKWCPIVANIQKILLQKIFLLSSIVLIQFHIDK